MYQTSALKITFENLPIIKIKAVEKKSPTMVGRKKIILKRNFESAWTRLQKISVLSHAFHEFFKRSSNEGIFHNFFRKKRTWSYKK